MKERTDAVTMKGSPLTLLGEMPVEGSPVPSFKALTPGLEESSLEAFAGKVRILLSVPSLDTDVCDLEVKRFEKEAVQLSEDVQILVISMDLPFAQERWCGANDVERVATLSDHRDAAFGTSYGVLIKELRLLARAAFVVDRDGILRYRQLVPELTEEPDYDAILEAVREIQ